MKDNHEVVGRTTGSVQATVDVLGGLSDCVGTRSLLTAVPGSLRIDVCEVESNCLVIATDLANPLTLFWSPLTSFLELEPDNHALEERIAREVHHPWEREILGTLLLFCRHRKWRSSNGLEIRVSGMSGQRSLLGADGRACLLRCLAQLSGLDEPDPHAMALLAVEAGAMSADQFHGLSEALVVEPIRVNSVLTVNPSKGIAPIPVNLPRDIVLVAWDSGVSDPHRARQSYIVRTAFFIGNRIVALETGEMDVRLPEIRPSRFRSELSRFLPSMLRGGAFTKNYGRHQDDMTRVHAPVDYPVEAAVRFVVEENFRISTTIQLLAGIKPVNRVSTMELIGEFLSQSHQGIAELCLSSAITNRMVQAVYARGASAGFYGARATNSGDGNLVLVLLERESLPELHRLLENFDSENAGVSRLLI